MGLAVVARFSTLTEAQVAWGALCSAGFHAEVFDQTFGTMVWTDQVAIGGFRIVAPEEELADAIAYLGEVQREAPRIRRPRSRGDGAWGVAAAVTAIPLGVDFSWLLLGIRRRLRRGQQPSFSQLAAVALLTGLTLVVLTLAAVLLLDRALHPAR